MNNQVLRQFVPLNELTSDNLQSLAQKTRIETLAKGKALFKRGDSDNFSFYLLSGELLMLGEGGDKKAIRGGTAPTRFPLEHHRPRRYTAIADSDCHFFRVDNDMLDILLTWDQNAGMMVADLEAEDGAANEDDDSDWMTMMLRSEIFHRIPPSNIQAVFMRMEPVPVSKGEVIIRQADEGDYYYFIQKGRCVVTHSTKTGKEIKLAELEAGTGFGEEALISDNKRNANVTMLTDGILMRMAKKDFVELLKAPVLQNVNYAKAKDMVARGDAVWLDVRLESEHKNVAIPDSMNIPLYLLRIKSRDLDHNTKYIVYCDTGRRSSSAAYLLSERGYDAYFLEGGLRSLQKEEAPAA